MPDAVLVENRAGLAAGPFDYLRQTLKRQTTLERALDWFFGQTPPLAPADLIAQDEFSYDLLVPYRGDFWLSYATN